MKESHLEGVISQHILPKVLELHYTCMFKIYILPRHQLYEQPPSREAKSYHNAHPSKVKV